MTSINLTKGHLLVAEPTVINDNSFNRSVVLIADHNQNGSVGFILNKPLEHTLGKLIPEVDSDINVFYGGPVEQDNLYFIHKIPDLIPNSIEIAHGIYWGGDFNMVLKLIKQKLLHKSEIRFFLGYSGWETNQLDQELEINSWVVVRNRYENKLIEKSHDNFWKEKMIELGGDYLIWANAPENPSLN